MDNSTMTTGMTEFDFLKWLFLEHFHSFLIFGFITLIIILILKPEITKNANIFFTKIGALFFPHLRKSYFNKNITDKISTAITNFNKSNPNLIKKLIPYSLRVEWVNSTDDEQTILNEKQAIIYVNNYKDEKKQVITILNSYIENAFVEKVKYYNEKNINKAIDIVAMRKILNNSSTNIFIIIIMNILIIISQKQYYLPNIIIILKTSKMKDYFYRY